MRVAAIIATVLTAATAVCLAIGQQPLMCLAVALPALGLGYAVRKACLRLQLASQFIIIGELVALGAVWPSLATIGALVSIPALVLTVVYALKGCASARGHAYVTVCTLIASVFMLWEGQLLARLPYEAPEGSLLPGPANIPVAPATGHKDPRD